MGRSIKPLIFAPSGWGKTRLIGGSPGRVLIIRPPIDHVDSILSKDRPRCQEWVVHDWSEMEDIEETLRLDGKQYDWVWLDSISGFQDIGLDDLWETIVIENPKRKRYGLDKGDYWINMQRLGRWVRNVVALSDSGAFNFGITAWPGELSPSPEDAEQMAKLMPWVQGRNMSMKVCGYMNMIGFGEVTEKGSRALHFMETDRFYAKTQFDDKYGSGTFKDANYRVLNPTMDKIIKMVQLSSGSSNGTAAKRKATTKRRIK